MYLECVGCSTMHVALNSVLHFEKSSKNTYSQRKTEFGGFGRIRETVKNSSQGDRLKLATKINLSLSALGNVISALVDGKTTQIPYS